MFRVNVYIETTIKAPARRAASAMWLVEFLKQEDPNNIVTRQGFVEFGETTEDAITLTALIEALSILNKTCKIVIFTKAQGVYHTVESRRNAEWKNQKWMKHSGNIIKNAELWEIASYLMDKHECSITIEEHSFQTIMRAELAKKGTNG